MADHEGGGRRRAHAAVRHRAAAHRALALPGRRPRSPGYSAGKPSRVPRVPSGSDSRCRHCAAAAPAGRTGAERPLLMRALALDAIGGLEHLAVRDLPEPTLQRGDDVRLRVRMAAFNHLDLWVAGGLPGLEVQLPHIVGSDAAGVVESVGPAVRGYAPGDRVMINPGLSCGTCAACVDGDEPLCRSFRLLGEHTAGGAAEFVVVPAANLAKVPDEMPWHQAAAFSLVTL